MQRARLAILVALALSFAGCTNKQECETCSSDDDCAAGLVCSTFDDGSRRCGQGTGATFCPMQ
jgi:hypothetical protein